MRKFEVAEDVRLLGEGLRFPAKLRQFSRSLRIAIVARRNKAQFELDE